MDILTLARHSGFTDAELNFIIHYNIKYRLGKQTSEVWETSEV